MLTRTITYTDYNGVERKENFLFNLTKAELMEMELSVNGGMAEMLQKVVDAKDGPTIMRLFKDLLLKAYGEKSEDGRRFMKSKEISEAFSQTEAYSIIYMELCTDDKKAAEFIEKIIPADIDMSEARAMLPQNMQTMN